MTVNLGTLTPDLVIGITIQYYQLLSGLGLCIYNLSAVAGSQ